MSIQKYLNLFFILFSISIFVGIAPTTISYYLLLLGFIIKNIVNKTNPFRYKPLNYTIWLFLAVLLIIELFHWDFPAMVKVLRQFVKVFLIFILIDTLKDEKTLKTGIFCWISAGVLSALLSLVSLYTGWHFLGRLVVNGMLAGFGHDQHITFACKLSFILIFLFLFLVDKYKKISLFKKCIIILSLFIILTAIFYIGSRGVLIGIYSTGLLLLFHKKYRIIPVILILTGILIYFVAFKTSYNVRSRTENFSENANIRMDLWKAVIKRWDKFIWGYGTDSYEEAMKEAEIPRNVVLPCHMHNNILQYFVFYGIPGLFIFLLFWAGIIYSYLKIKQNKTFTWIEIACLWSILIFQVNGLTDANWLLASTKFTICYIIGMLFVKTVLNINKT